MIDKIKRILIKLNIIKMKNKVKLCSVTNRSYLVDNFYGNHAHCKQVDNFRRTTGIPVKKLRKLFNQIENA